MFDDVLDYLGSALDKPGRAVRGALGGNFEELGAAIPFSDTLGITDPRDRVTGSDLAERYFGLHKGTDENSLAGLGVDLLTDPLTYLGGAAGRAGGRALGRFADTAAVRHGPGYATTAAELADTIPHVYGLEKFQALRANPAFNAALSEIPEGSKYLGSGAEAVAFRTPAGDVARMSQAKPGAFTRPIDPDVLPTSRTATAAYPGYENMRSGVRVERTPYAQPVADAMAGSTPSFGTMPTGLSPTQAEAYKGLQASLGSRGIDFFDRHAGNVGLHGGKPVVLDPGALDTVKDIPVPAYRNTRVELQPAFTGQMAPDVPVGMPLDRTSQVLMRLLNGRGRLRNALAAGQSTPGFESSLGNLGMATGATLGGVR